jgi:hypothetical protein
MNLELKSWGGSVLIKKDEMSKKQFIKEYFRKVKKVFLKRK